MSKDREEFAVLRLETHWVGRGCLFGRSSFSRWLRAAAGVPARVWALIPVQPAPKDSVDCGAGVALKELAGVVRLPNCQGYMRAYACFPVIALHLLRLRWRVSKILVRVPEHLNLLLLPALWLMRFEVTAWVVADREAIDRADMERRHGSWLATLGGLLSRATGAMERLYLARLPLIVNGWSLAKKMPLSCCGRRLVVISTNVEREMIPAVECTGKLAGNTLNLLYVGRISREKGLCDLVDAIATLRRERRIGAYGDIRLSVVGWSAHGEQERLAAHATKEGVEGCITFVGALPHGESLFDYFRRSEIFVLPSWTEGTPRVLIEAMAFGCPAVVTDVGGVLDVVSNRQTALVVPARAPARLAEAIAELATNAELRDRLRCNARQRVANLTVENLAAQMAEFILEAPPH